jgi:hypothetical protein
MSKLPGPLPADVPAAMGDCRPAIRRDRTARLTRCEAGRLMSSVPGLDGVACPSPALADATGRRLLENL